MPGRLYYAIGLAILVLILLPALVAGGGLLLALLLVLVLAIALFGGPHLWDLHKQKSMGERGRADVRDMIAGDSENVREGEK